MRAVVCQHAELRVAEMPEPKPASGQVRLRVLRCGICGSDLHARHGCDQWADMAAHGGYHRLARSAQPIVYGLGGVDAAFTALSNPDRHAKILIDPQAA